MRLKSIIKRDLTITEDGKVIKANKNANVKFVNKKHSQYVRVTNSSLTYDFHINRVKAILAQVA
jgi:hypothetical protein